MTNFANRIYYYIKIGEMAYHHQANNSSILQIDPYLVKINNRAKRFIRYLNWITLVIILITVGSLVWVTIYAITDTLSELKEAEVITGTVFTTWACLFSIVGYFILKRLRYYFPEFHAENRKMIIFATCGLSLSLLTRGLIDNLRYFSETVSKHANDHENLYNSLLLILCDLIPISF